MNGTKDLVLEYSRITNTIYTFESGIESTLLENLESQDELEFKEYSDASFADNVNTRRSIQGIKFELFKRITD